MLSLSVWYCANLLWSDLVARVKALGFAEVWDVGPEEANARYFAGRTDGLRASPLYHLMKGQVGSVS